MLRINKLSKINVALALSIILIICVTINKICYVVRFDPRSLYYVDMYYWIGFGLIVFLLSLKKIYYSSHNKISKFGACFVSIAVIGITTLSLALFTPSYLKRLSYEGVFISKEESYFYGKLKELRNLKNKEGNLRDLTNFEWETVIATSGYSPSEEPTYLAFYKDNKLIKVINGNQKLFTNEIVKDGAYIEFIKSRHKDGKNYSHNSKFKITFKQHDYPSGYHLRIYTMTIH